jgi:hypothetical protein
VPPIQFCYESKNPLRKKKHKAYLKQKKERKNKLERKIRID